MNPIPTSVLAIEIAFTGHTANGSGVKAAVEVPVLVFPRVGGRCFGAIFNASPSLADGHRLSTATLPATLAMLGLRPRTVSFRSTRAHA